MHNSIKRAVSIVIAAIVLFSLPCGSIFARTHIDIDKKCSITVDIPDTWEDLYTVDFPVELYRVADVDENDVYTATKQFDKLAKSISDISSKTTADDWEKMAKTTGDSINHRGISRAMSKLKGTALIVEGAGSIQPMKVFCIEVGEKYKDELRYKLIWDRLTNYARQRNEEKSNDKFVSLSMDDPAITPIDKCRFYLGVIIDNKENDSQPGVMEVPGGRYAVFRHIGDYSLLHKFYRTIYEEWFPESKYRPQSTFSFEMYMNRPASTLKTELITDIYIPVIKK